MRQHNPFLRAAALVGSGLAFAGAAFALDYPPRKPGLWEMSVGDAGAKTPPQVMQQCIDAATDQLMRDMGQGTSKDLCSKNELRADGPRLVVDSVCKVGPEHGHHARGDDRRFRRVLPHGNEVQLQPAAGRQE